MKHTPAPWTAHFGEMAGYDCMTDAWVITKDDNRKIAVLDLSYYGQFSCSADYSAEFRPVEAEANARLIAAAPDLADILQKVLTACNNSQDITSGTASLMHVLYREVQQRGAALLAEIERES